jgi:hypothetical protein
MKPDHRSIQQLHPAYLGEGDHHSLSELWNKGTTGFEHENLILNQLVERSGRFTLTAQIWGFIPLFTPTGGGK